MQSTRGSKQLLQKMLQQLTWQPRLLFQRASQPEQPSPICLDGVTHPQWSSRIATVKQASADSNGERRARQHKLEAGMQRSSLKDWGRQKSQMGSQSQLEPKTVSPHLVMPPQV